MYIIISKFIDLLKLNGFDVNSGNKLTFTLEEYLHLVEDTPAYKISKIKIHKEVRKEIRRNPIIDIIYCLAEVQVNETNGLRIFISQDIKNNYFSYDYSWIENIMKYELLLAKFEQKEYFMDFIY